MKTHTIKIDWQSLKSIEAAEKRKEKLENSGWKLVSQSHNTLTYQQ